MQEINVEQIMQEIREDVEKKNIQEPPVRVAENVGTRCYTQGNHAFKCDMGYNPCARD